jgi:protein-S-isoprenylcysteine O-methyltransferase Ste14
MMYIGDMIYVLTGSIAFVLFFMFDYCKMKKVNVGRNLASLSGVTLFLYSVVMTVSSSVKVYIPIIIRLTSVVMLAPAVALLIYSLFLELPFRSTYADKKYNNSLVDTGTYALCRHPGVLWLFLTLMFLALLSGATLTAIGGVVWTVVNIIYVYLQEKVFFCSMFEGYREYQKTTPMLIPNKNSLKRCFESFYMDGGNSNEKLGQHD